MPIISCCNWDNNFLSDFFKKINPSLSSTEKNILICGSFIEVNNVDFIKNFNGKKVLFITEPIEYIYFYAYQLYKEGVFDLVCGCSINDNGFNGDGINYVNDLNDVNTKNIIYSKYPLYLLYNFPKDISIFEKVNEYVRNVDISELLKKQFCSLINNHDKGKTRLPMYDLMSKIGYIECPSTLNNNTSNDELNRIGKVEYCKRFIFSICSENYKTEIKGYITEKIYEACMSGCIPIYFGDMDDMDYKIFNKNRILFYDPFSEDSLNNISNKISEMMNHPEQLLEFYRQDVFLPTALQTSIDMENNFRESLDKLI